MCGGKSLHVFVSSSSQHPVHYVNCVSVPQQTHTATANITRNDLQRKRKETITTPPPHPPKKNLDQQGMFFNKEEVNYDNYSNW